VTSKEITEFIKNTELTDSEIYNITGITPQGLKNRRTRIQSEVDMRQARVMALPDLHLPYNIDLTSVEKFMADFKPTHLLYLGDTLNFDCVSHWIESQIKDREGLRLKDDYDQVNTMIERHRKIVGKNCELIYFLGNHENWINQAVAKLPQFEGMLEVETWVKGVDKFISFNKTWSIGHLTYLHGMWCNKYHGAKHLDAYMTNLI
jgi:hypothetical protein